METQNSDKCFSSTHVSQISFNVFNGLQLFARVTLGLAATEGKHPGFLGVRVTADANLQLAWLGFSFVRNLRNDALCHYKPYALREKKEK